VSALPDGLPGLLPLGERVLWRGKPAWQTLARRGFHFRKLAIYLGVLLAWYIVTAFTSQATLLDAALSSLKMTGIAATPLALVQLYAWVSARSTIYTITNRRVMMKIGIAMPITFNIPYAKIDAAGVKTWSNGHGDLALTLPRTERMSYFVLWPHAKPWHMAYVEPMLRCIPNAQAVGQILGRALAAHAGNNEPAAAPVSRIPANAFA
jgi:hypothetical protein